MDGIGDEKVAPIVQRGRYRLVDQHLDHGVGKPTCRFGLSYGKTAVDESLQEIPPVVQIYRSHHPKTGCRECSLYVEFK